jgi:hypothetical protein
VAEKIKITPQKLKMSKNLNTFIALLTVSIFITACHSLKPQPVKPPKAETPKVETPKPKPSPTASFYKKYADILQKYVDDQGLVDYTSLKRKRFELMKLLFEFDNFSPNKYNTWSQEEKIALWINLYNIQMLNIIVNNYPIESSRIHRLLWSPNSIRHIKGIWTKYKFIVMDEEFTLDEIEKRFLRKQFNEPRIFLALSQASLSSPPLRNEPYYGQKLDQQLNEQTKKFLANPLAFQINREEKTVHLSAILQPTWFGNEFVSKFGTDKKFKDHPPAVRAVLNFITNYVTEQDIHFLEVENYAVKFLKYDWTLNDSP